MDLILLTVIVVVILPLSILFIFHNQKKLQKPPGPIGLPLIGNLHQFYTASPHIYLSKLSAKYGPLMSMKLGSRPALIVSSPRMAKQVFKTNDLSFCSRPRALGTYKMSYDGSDMTFAPYSEAWRELRKICIIHLLSNKQVQSFRPIREDEVSRMIRNLRAKAGQVVNLSEMMLSLTSSLICRIAFGTRSDDEEESKQQRFNELMAELQAMVVCFLFSDYLPSFAWVDKYSGMIRRLEKVRYDFDEFYQGLIDEHLDHQNRGKTGDPNILDLLIQLKQDKSCSIDLTWNHVKAIISDIFIAGTDTGAATIVWTMTALMQNPTALKKLQTEIRYTIGQKGELVNEDDLQNLPYLKAAIKEALRLYPPAPLLLPRETLAQCEIEGYTIPAKTMVFINAWAIARDPEYWENPNEFLPDRFLNTSVDILGQDFQVIPFGSGRRGCPGIAMGLATVELVLANLLYCFDWELPCGMKTQDIDTQVLPGIIMHKKTPLCLVPKHYI